MSQLARNQGGTSKFQGVYIEVKEYVLKQEGLGYPKLSTIARARATVKYDSDTT
jgi:hypothetical protein